MTRFSSRTLIAVCILTVGQGYSEVSAGLHSLFSGHGSAGCGCQQSSAATVYAAPAVWHAAPAVQAGCNCGIAAASCCGMGGAGGVGMLYADQFGGMATSTGGFDPGAGSSGLTGYEGLPNMDGGCENYRYPYHSYRRPWFHPGPQATNISIVW